MLPKKMVKIICIVLAALMLLSGVAVLVQVFASDAATVTAAPSTGDNDLDTIVPIALIAAAVLAIVACLVLPKLKKKN